MTAKAQGLAPSLKCKAVNRIKELKKVGILQKIADLAEPVISAGAAIYNAYEGHRQYEKNFAFNQSEANIAREREDNQIQRATADATAAGFSPLAALGNTASGATVSAPSSNASSTLDMTPLLSMFENQAQRQHETEMQTQSLNAQKEMANASNLASLKIARINAGASKYSADTGANTAAKQLQETKRQFNRTFTETLRQNKAQENYQDRTLIQIINAQNEEMEYKYAMMYQKWYEDNKVDGAPMGKYCSTWDEYRTELNTWLTKATTELDKNGDDTDYKTLKKAISETQAKLGGEAGAGQDLILQSINALLKGEIGTSSEATGQTEKNISTGGLNNRRWEAYLKSNPLPIPPMPEEMKRKKND